MNCCPPIKANVTTFPIYFLLSLFARQAYAQITLHTDDLPRFYQAMDSVLTTSDTISQVAFIQRLYVDKVSVGLRSSEAVIHENGRNFAPKPS